MRWNNIFSPVGLGMEYKTIPKQEPISLGAAAAIAGGSALISSLGNWLSQDSANRANASMDRETRNWQSMENEKARQWSEYMWNQENQYNTPSAQRKRLQEAGYNPWISGSGGSMSNVAQTPPAATMAGAPNRTPMQPVSFNGVGQAGADIVSTLYSGQQVKADVANQNADTAIKLSKAATEMLSNGLNKETVYDWYQTQLRSLGMSDKQIDSYQNAINQEFLARQIKNDRDSLEYFLRNEFGHHESERKLKILDREISKLDEDISLVKKQQNLTDNEITLKANQAAQALEASITDKETRAFVKRKLEAEAKILEADPMASDWFSGLSKGSGVVANVAKFISLIIKAMK